MDIIVNAQKVAEYLLQINAVQLNPEHPFTWASGLKSPIYCDNRKTLSFPQVRSFLQQQMTAIIRQEMPKPDVIAGVATGGIALGALVADALDLPFIYVRSEAKKHGLGNRIEGVLQSGQSVIVIEDLISTGTSSLNAVTALREANANVLGMIAIFTYGLQSASDNFSKANCALHTLCNYDILLQQALEMGVVKADEMETLTQWKNNPEAWSLAMA